MKKLSLLKLGIFVPVISMCLIFSNVVFAKQFKVYATNGSVGAGFDTGIILEPGQMLVISVDEKDTWGTAGATNKALISNANGLGNSLGHNFGKKYTKSGFSFLFGSLVGSLDGGKTFFLVGSKLEKTILKSGKLSLYHWDSNNTDNSGYLTATIHVKSDCNSNKIAKAYTRTGAGESLVAPFTSPATSTTKSYSGLVEVIVSGTGYSYGMTVNDAFFGVKTGKPLDPQYYQLNIGWNGAPLKPYAEESRNIANYIKFVDGMGKAAVPTYNSNHRYHFVIEVPKDAGRLSFGVSDGGFDENGGQYNIEIHPVKNNVFCNSISEVIINNKAIIKSGDPIVVSYKNLLNRNQHDWIGIYKKGSNNNQFITYQYSAKTSGELSFNSKTLAIGEYELRMLAKNQYSTVKAVSSFKLVAKEDSDSEVIINNKAIIKSGDPIVVSYKNLLNRNQHDWIGIYKKGSNNNQFITYQYSAKTSGELSFNSKTLAIGEYELRMLAKNQYSVVKARSNFKIVNID